MMNPLTRGLVSVAGFAAGLIILSACTGKSSTAGSAAAADPVMGDSVRASGPQDKRWAIVIHGGAGSLERSIPAELRTGIERGLNAAADAGTAVLARGGTSLDAVEAAVRVLEDDENFNAGRGAVLTREGTAELDASIMDGSNLKCGAVAGVKTVKNPISFARRIMQETPHILFAGPGAERLADQFSVPRVDPTYFITPRRQEQLRKKMGELGLPVSSASPVREKTTDLTCGTVGCVAIDMNGHIAAATSTGGMTAKMPGRIGDSPIIGAGNYACDKSIGISCTGTGEQYIRNVAAHEVASLVRYAGDPLTKAARVVLTERLEIDDGGMIAIDREGHIIAFTTTGSMPRVIEGSGLPRIVKIWE